MKLGQRVVARLNRAGYYVHQYSLLGVPLEMIFVAACLVVLGYLGWRGFRFGLSAPIWLAMVALLLLLGIFYWLRFRRYTFFAARNWGIAGETAPLRPEKALQARASGYLEVSGLREYLLDVPALIWITELDEYILMARVVFRKFLLLEPMLENQGMWYAFIKPGQISRLRSGMLLFGLLARPTLEVSYQTETGEARILYLAFGDQTAFARLVGDMSRRTDLAVEPRAVS